MPSRDSRGPAPPLEPERVSVCPTRGSHPCASRVARISKYTLAPGSLETVSFFFSPSQSFELMLQGRAVAEKSYSIHWFPATRGSRATHLPNEVKDQAALR